MPDVTFVAAELNEPVPRFVSAVAASRDVRASLVCEDPPERVPEPVRAGLSEVVQVSSAADTGLLSRAVEELHRRGQEVSLLLTASEALELPVAVLRDRLGLRGMGPHAAANFLERERAADVLRGRDMPVSDPGAEGGEGRGLVGFLLDGALVWSAVYEQLPVPPELKAAPPGVERIVVLPDAARDDPAAGAMRELAGEALRALGLRTGMCRLDFRLGADGAASVSRVDAWPPEPWSMELVAWARDLDLHRAWADVMVHGEFTPPAGGWAAGAISFRGAGAELEKLSDAEDPAVETKTLRLEESAGESPGSGESVLLVRHPDTGVVRDVLWKILGRYGSVDA